MAESEEDELSWGGARTRFGLLGMVYVYMEVLIWLGLDRLVCASFGRLNRPGRALFHHLDQLVSMGMLIMRCTSMVLCYSISWQTGHTFTRQ